MPFGGRAKRPKQMGQSVCLQGGKRVESPPTFIGGKRQKNQKDEGLWNLKMRVRELFTHKESISTRHARNKGQQPQCAYRDFKMIFFSLFYIFSLFTFFIFLGSTRVLPSLLCILRCDEEIRPTQFFKFEILCITLILSFLKDFTDLNQFLKKNVYTPEE